MDIPTMTEHTKVFDTFVRYQDLLFLTQHFSPTYMYATGWFVACKDLILAGKESVSAEGLHHSISPIPSNHGWPVTLLQASQICNVKCLRSSGLCCGTPYPLKFCT